MILGRDTESLQSEPRPVIRDARAEDAAALAVLAEHTFRDTFSTSATVENDDRHCARAFGPAVQAAEIADPATDTLVATDGEALMAYAQLQRGDSPECVTKIAKGPAIRVQRFYVLQAFHGSGLAADLMQAVLERAAAHSAETVWLGVWGQNPRAIRFYRKWGFAEVGDHTFMLGNEAMTDLVFAAPLSQLHRPA